MFDEDQDLRVEMCERLIPIFEDEDNFHVSEMVNKHNCRIWSDKNPFMTMDIAMSSKQIIGPFFFDDEIVNQSNYLDMLQNYLHPILQKKMTNQIHYFPTRRRSCSLLKSCSKLARSCL